MPRTYSVIPLEVRFHAKVRKTDTCWLWTGYIKPNGYGSVAHDRKGHTWYAHRAAWELANGPIPEGVCVLHRCDVRACVRPDHLFLGTKADNTQDMFNKGRGYSAFRDTEIRSLAVARGTESRRKYVGLCRVLTNAQMAYVRTALDSGRTQDSLASELGVSQHIISRVKLGELTKGRDSRDSLWQQGSP